MRTDIFFDVDGTLIDEEYRTNIRIEEFRQTMRSLGSEARFHLNSNRSLSQLRNIYDLFGCNGQIIMENGCCTYDPRTGALRGGGFRPFDRQALVKILPEYPLIYTDTNTLEAITGQANGPIIFAEQSRQYTMTLYPRESCNGRLQRNNELFSDVALKAQALAQAYDIEADAQGYMNILFKPRGALKSGVMQSLAGSAAIQSFGNGNDDITMFLVSQYCGAPANAPQAVKQAALRQGGMVATKSYTRGAQEFLISTLRRGA